MSVFKKHLTPLSPGGAIHKHEGKGARPFTPPPGAGINNFAKATPMAQPQASPMPPLTQGPPTPFPGV